MVDSSLNRQMRNLLGHTLRISFQGSHPLTGIVEEVHLHCLVMRDPQGVRHYLPWAGIEGWKDGRPGQRGRRLQIPA